MQSFDLNSAQEKVIPIIASVPHSGMWIPEKVACYFNSHHMNSLRNTDWFIDSLFNFLPSMGITVLKANFSRYVIDVNRTLKEPLLGSYKRCPIYSHNTWGEEIYERAPPAASFSERIEDYYLPYHQELEKNLNEMRVNFGSVVLLDLHSFMGLIENDICLGDAKGKSCPAEIRDIFYEAFGEAGYDVVLNAPFSGGHIVKYYSNFPGIYSLQIELRYTSYLGEQDFDGGIIPDMECDAFFLAREKLKTAFQKLIPKVLSQLSSM